MGETLGILLLSGEYERAHYAFMVAAGAGAIGRRVVLFASNGGCRALMVEWGGLAGAGADAVVQARGVAGFVALREAAGELGVRLMVCDSGMRMAGLEAAGLLGGVEVAGIPSFLSAVGGGQVITL